MENTTYQLIDTHTGRVIATYTYTKRNRARNRADRMDQAYGAYRYAVQPIFADQPADQPAAK